MLALGLALLGIPWLACLAGAPKASDPTKANFKNWFLTRAKTTIAIYLKQVWEHFIFI